MNAQPLTATWHEAEILDLTEALLLANGRRLLTQGKPAQLVADLITAAVDDDPRLGMAMDVCDRHGCSVLVDANARDEHNNLYCSPACEDDAAECREANMRHALLVDGRHDITHRRIA